MSDAVPEHYLCPISRDVMADPVMVDHQGHVYWFDKKCLDAHSKTRYADQNPLTNLAGFRDAPRARDEALGDEIMKSRWAPDQAAREETICVSEDPPQESPLTITTLFDIVLPHEIDTHPGIYRLLTAIDMLPLQARIFNTVRHSVASLDTYVLDVLDSYYDSDPDMFP